MNRRWLLVPVVCLLLAATPAAKASPVIDAHHLVRWTVGNYPSIRGTRIGSFTFQDTFQVGDATWSGKVVTGYPTRVDYDVWEEIATYVYVPFSFTGTNRSGVRNLVGSCTISRFHSTLEQSVQPITVTAHVELACTVRLNNGPPRALHVTTEGTGIADPLEYVGQNVVANDCGSSCIPRWNIVSNYQQP